LRVTANMTDIAPEKIKKAVRDVLNELGLRTTICPKGARTSRSDQGPRVLMVFLAGVRKLDVALEQSRIIETAAGKCGVFTGESARAFVCGDDVRDRVGAHCILDTVKPEGIEKVLERADILVLPTLCLKVAAKVAALSCDTQESNLVFTALLLGKKVLAASDGFLICDMLANDGIKAEIERILNKLEGFGMTFCPTDQLSVSFERLVQGAQAPSSATPPEDAKGDTLAPLRLITAKAITAAANDRRTSLRLAPGGKVTPLARDLAREYGIEIIETR